MLCMKVTKRVNPKKKIFFLSYFVSIRDDGCSLTYCDNHFMMYLSQIIMLYTLKLYSAVCQFYLHKTGKRFHNTVAGIKKWVTGIE